MAEETPHAEDYGWVQSDRRINWLAVVVATALLVLALLFIVSGVAAAAPTWCC